MNCCNHNKMPRPVRGNAFNVAVTVVARRIDGTVIDDFALTSEAVLKITHGTSSTEKEYTIIGQNVAVIHFDGTDAAGIYGVEFTGEWHGEPWRFSVPVVFQIVELTTQGWLPQDGIIYEPTYEVDAEIVIAGGGVQADWTETDPDSPAYIQHKPNIYTQTETDALLANKQNTLVSGQNIKTINGNSLVGSGDVAIPTGLTVAYEVVDAGTLYLDQTQAYYEVPATVYTALKAVWDAGKVPVLTGSLFHHTTSFTLIPTYLTDSFFCFYHGTNTMSGNRWHLSGRLFAGVGGQLYPEEEQELLVSGTNIKTIDGTSLLGSGDIVIGVEEINVTGTIAGSLPNMTIVINDYASFYADLVDANAQGKVPVVRMHLTQGGNVYEYSGIASSYNGWQFVGTFQMQGNYVLYNKFNRPTDTVPYEFDVVRLQEQLVSGTNIKTINGNSLVGSGNVTIPTGLTVAYEVVDAGTLYLDQTNTYYEVPSTVYTALKAVWDAGKVPVLTGALFYHTTAFALIPTYANNRFSCFWHYPHKTTIANWNLFGFIDSNGGKLYHEEEQKPITVDQTVIAGSTNPVSSTGVKTYVDGVVGNINSILDQINGEVI